MSEPRQSKRSMAYEQLILALATAASAQHQIDFVGGGVDGDTQARAMVPRGCRLSGSDHPAVRRDDDLMKKPVETRQSGDRIKWVARRENGSLNSGQREDERRTAPISPWLSTIRSAGSTPARLHQHQHRVHYRYDSQGRAWGWLDCNDFGGGIMGPASAAPEVRVSGAKRWSAKWQGKAHFADTALHLGATSADAASSWGRVELNPLLRSSDGRFGAKGVAIKGAFALGVEIIKWRLAKRYPRERWVRVLSLGPAVIFGGVAARNWRVR